MYKILVALACGIIVPSLNAMQRAPVNNSMRKEGTNVKQRQGKEVHALLVEEIKAKKNDLLRKIVHNISVNKLINGKTLLDYAQEAGNQEAVGIIKNVGGKTSAALK
jgi:hypothetical protein